MTTIKIVDTFRRYKIVLDLGLFYMYNIYIQKSIEAGDLMIEFAIFVFCIIGSSISCHALGRQQGIEATIEHLVDKGLLEITEKDEH
jgi:hypothetical protein